MSSEADIRIAPGAEALPPRPPSAWNKLLRDPMGLAGLILVATFILMAVFAPLVAPL